MTPERIAAAAALLRQARGDARALADVPEKLRPATLAEGYAIQDAFVQQWDARIGGWKVACTAEDQRRLVGIDTPISGRIFTNVLLRSPAELPAAAFNGPGLEGEFAFRMARALPPRDEPYDGAEVADAVATVHPAVEVVDSRLEGWVDLGGPMLVADNAVNGALICGEGEKNWRRFDLARQTVRLDIDGRTVEEGAGSRVLGHPLRALTWLVNHLRERGIALEAEHFVTTGTCTGLHFVSAGADARADFGALGAVRVTISG